MTMLTRGCQFQFACKMVFWHYGCFNVPLKWNVWGSGCFGVPFQKIHGKEWKKMTTLTRSWQFQFRGCLGVAIKWCFWHYGRFMCLWNWGFHFRKYMAKNEKESTRVLNHHTLPFTVLHVNCQLSTVNRKKKKNRVLNPLLIRTRSRTLFWIWNYGFGTRAV